MDRRLSTLAAVVLVAFIAIVLAGTGRAFALPGGFVPRSVQIADPALLCRAAIHMAEADLHTPAGLLGAIATVESGRPDHATGKIAPWPWTINAGGTGHAYATEAEAVSAAQRFQQQGIASLDIGCMQVNLEQHPAAFANLAQAFNPMANALYAARFLTDLKARLGGWTQATAAYHSQTPALGQPYAAKVLAAWRGVAAVPHPTIRAAVKPAMPAKPGDAKADGRPHAVPVRQFGLGGFAFAALHGRARILPIATQAAARVGRMGAPGGLQSSTPIARGLAAYRRMPIPITGAAAP